MLVRHLQLEVWAHLRPVKRLPASCPHAGVPMGALSKLLQTPHHLGSSPHRQGFSLHQGQGEGDPPVAVTHVHLHAQHAWITRCMYRLQVVCCD